MQLPSRKRFYDNEALCRLEAIFERTCIDLKIDDQSPYARATREMLARLLFTVPVPDTGLIQPMANRFSKLLAFYRPGHTASTDGAVKVRNI